MTQSSFSTKPELFPEAPVGAIEKILNISGLKVEDIDIFEINEAFSLVPIIASKKLNIDMDKINIYGGAVSIGHPTGASGGRLALTLARQLQLHNKKYGIATLCIGGGEAVAVLFEKI